MAENNKNMDGQKGDKPGGPKMPQFNAYWIYGIILVSLVAISLFNVGQSPQTVPWSVFEDKILPGGDITRVVVVTNEGKAEITLKEEALDSYAEVLKDQSSLPRTGPHFEVRIPTLDKLEEARKLAEEEGSMKIPIEYEERTNLFRDFFMMMWPILLIVAIWIFIFRSMSSGGGGGAGGNIFNVGKSKARMFDKETGIKVNFDDVAGLVEAKTELEEIVEFLRKPEKFTELGGKIPKGALLVGPPGTGKTLLARAVAGEAQDPFFSLSGSDFVEMFVGVGASRVRDLFKQAKDKAPSIIFIDEIDAIGRARGKNNFSGSNDERENTLNQLLTEMDGFGTSTNVIVLAATNRGDVLDKALMRAGRFDRQIYVDLPDVRERKEIFEVHLRPIKQGDDLDVDFLAKQTPGFSGADIANVCNEAALIAARGMKKAVEKQDFLDAVDRIVGGLEKKNKIMTVDEKRAIAFHEAGHATVSWMLEHAAPLVKVTIVPRGQSLGAAWYLPEERLIIHPEQMLDEMCAALAGRAAEKVIFDRISTGALSDLEKVTKQARAMVTIYGLNEKVGNLTYYDSSGQSQYNFTKPYSEKTAELIDKEISNLIEEQYQRAVKILEENKDKLTQLANVLLEKEVIFKDNLEEIFGVRPFDKDKAEAHDLNLKKDTPETDQTIEESNTEGQ